MTQDELLALIDQAEREEWTELDLSNKGLTEPPPEIGRLIQLEKLELGSSFDSKTPNKLVGLPSEICRLSDLTKLNLVGNNLTELPPEICRFIKLVDLNLGFNKLEELPLEITKLENLLRLHLAGNNLQQLPDQIVRLSKLEILTLIGNPLVEIPSCLGLINSLWGWSIEHLSEGVQGKKEGRFEYQLGYYSALSVVNPHLFYPNLRFPP